MASAKPPADPELREKLTTLVGRLTADLGIGGGRSAEGLAAASVAMLSKMTSPYDVTKVAVQQTQKTLTENAPDKRAFASEYARLKAMNVRELDKYLNVVAKIVQDPDLLAAVSTPRAPARDDEADSSRPAPPGLAPPAAPAAPPAAARDHRLDHRRDDRRDPRPGDDDDNSRFDFSDAPAVSDAGGADVTSLPMESFSFSTNPLASEETGPGSSGGTPRASGLRRMDEVESDPDPRGGGLDPRSRSPAIGEAPRAAARTPLVAASPFATAAMDRALTEGVDYPALPDWTGTRPYLTGEHLGSRDAAGGDAAPEPGKPLSAYSTACQELLILDDLLYAMMGVEGRYVRAERTNGGSVRFFVDDDGLEGSLAALVEDALPLCSAAAAVSAYVESQRRFEGGLVAHALAAEMQELLHDWHTMVVQLEHQRNVGRLSLQATRFYCQPAVAAMELLAAIAARAPALRGAPLLNMLHAEAADRAGDAAARELLLRLLRAAAAPYARAVERWVYEGRVDDPYDEFLVLERAHLRKESLAEDYNASYWTRRYALRADVPVFLGGDLAEKALTTGKYLNAIRESGTSRRSSGGGESGSGRDDAAAFAMPPKPKDGLGRIALGTSGGGTHAARIDAAFKHASNGLLRAVLEEGDLHARLCSLKRYFLLDQGDFLVHFVDIAGHELRRRAPDISVNKLQSLLELSLKLSTAASDPRNEDLTCGLERQGIIHQLLSIHVAGEDGGLGPASGGGGHEAMTPKEALRLTGMDTFVLDYQAPWPVSLVLSRRALTKYQLLFRHVFHCKHVERELCAAWQTHQSTRKAAAGAEGVGASLERAYAVSQRMLHFLQNFTYYLTCEVVEPNWHVFERSLPEATTVDELIDLHERFLDACMKEGMLFWPKILRRLEKIKQSCLKFAEATAALERGVRRQTLAGEPSAYGEDGEPTPRAIKSARERVEARREAAASIVAAAEDEGFVETMLALESEFDAQLRELLESLNHSAHLEPNLASLCARLDFNEFYTFGPGGKYA